MNQAPTMDRAKSKKIELVLQQLDSLPTLPAIAARLLHLTVSSNTQAEEVVRMIESDPSLTSKIIALATRASRGVSGKATASLSRAVVLLGFDAVRNAVLSIKVFEALGGNKQQESGVFDRVEFWRHSLAVACAAKMLIKHIDGKVDPEEAFVCGLLHDMGKVALDSTLPKSFERVVQLTESSLGNIARVEQRILGVDHTVAGKRLAEKWNFPQAIAETVWLHHQDPMALPEQIGHRSIIQTIYLADLMVREQRIGYSGNHNLSDSAVTVGNRLKCPEAAIQQISRALREEIGERSVMLGLDVPEPEELYHEALTQANRELGVLNQKMRQSTEKLLTRSRYLDMISDLNQALPNSKSITAVCDSLAELWQKYNNSAPTAVYAQSSDGLIVEGSIRVGNEDDGSVFLVDRVDDPDAADNNLQQGSGFELSAARLSEPWFFEQVAPMFDMACTMRFPLVVGDNQVGALLWVLPEGDKQGLEGYKRNLKELQDFASHAALAISQAIRVEEQSNLTEQLAQANQMLHEAQRELLQKRSLAAVGEMACGAAHEINNPLSIVVGRAQFLASSEPDEKRKGMLENIARQGQETSRIISDLMEFAKPVPPRPAVTQIGQLIERAVDGVQERLGESKRQVQIKLQDELPEVFVDPEQICWALSELINNAVHSYGGKAGAVEITGTYCELDSEVILEVIDQGCGMNDETLRKAFDPFFSARAAGRGRGLGLSRSSQYVEGSGGRLSLVSEHKSGTVARMTLPIAQIGSGPEMDSAHE